MQQNKQAHTQKGEGENLPTLGQPTKSQCLSRGVSQEARVSSNQQKGKSQSYIERPHSCLENPTTT